MDTGPGGWPVAPHQPPQYSKPQEAILEAFSLRLPVGCLSPCQGKVYRTFDSLVKHGGLASVPQAQPTQSCVAPAYDLQSQVPVVVFLAV